MLTQMITETLLGALTGYVTNNTAIRSLFQPGGVIEKTRDAFAREAGQLLEDQVLTQKVLAQQLQLPEVQQILAQTLASFLHEALPAAFANQTLADLPGYEQAAANLQQVLIVFFQQEKDKILSLCKKHLSLEELLTKQQCEKLADQLERLLLETIRQENLAFRFWQCWQAEKGQHTLEQLGLTELCTVIITNLAEQSKAWFNRLQAQYSREMEELLLQTVQRIQLHPVLLELDQQMEQYTVQQYCNCSAQELVTMLTAFLDSNDGQHRLAFLADKLVEALTTVDIAIEQVVPAEILEALQPVLQQKMPLVLEMLVQWFKQNQQSVNAMLESAINEVVAASGGMKGIVLEQLKDTILEQTLQQADGAVFLKQFLSNEQSTEQTVDLLLEKIRVLLTEQSVGELVQRYNGQGQIQFFFQSFLKENLQQLLHQSGLALAEQLLAFRPGSLHLAQRQEQVEQIVVQFLLQGLQQIDIQSLLLQKGHSVQQIRVGHILQPKEEQVQQFLEQLVQQSCQQIAQQLPNRTADELLQPLYAALEQWLQQKGPKWLKDQGEQCSLPNLIRLLDPAFQRQQPQMLQWLSTSGLAGLQGRLSRLAAGQIGALREDEMLRLVEEFMGQELKPLNYLGAGMGAVAGATVGTALAVVLPVTAAGSPALLVSALAGKSAIFGAVGYGTNCAAVKGLFWPYAPLGGIKMLQGVIPKQKERFAHSMGQMVDRYVINEDVLAALLEQNHSRWLHLGTALATDQQKMVRLSAVLAGNRKKIANKILQQMEQSGAEECRNVLQHLGSKPLAFLSNNRQENGFLTYQQFLQQMERQINIKLRQKISMQKFVSAEQIWRWINQWICAKSVPDLVFWGKQLLQTEKSLQQLLPVQQKRWQEQLEHRITAWLGQQENCLNLARQFGNLLPEQCLKEWLENHSEQWLEQNLNKLFSWLEQALLQMLSKKQDKITTAVQNAILDRMGLMQQLGYTMMGGDKLVAQVVERVIQQKFPILLTIKRKELKEQFSQCWQQHLFPALLQLPIKPQQMQFVLEILLAQPAVAQCAASVLNQSFAIIYQQPIVSWGKWLSINDILERLQIQLGFQWQMHGEEAVACWQPFVQTFCTEQILTLSLHQLTQGFHGVIPLARILDCESANPLLSAFFLRLQENMAITELQQWCHWPEAATALEHDIAALFKDDHTTQWVSYETERLILQISAEWDRLLPEQTRCALIEAVVQAAFATAQKNGSQILSAMRLAQLTEEQITQMNSAHLEQVVRGFAAPYLVHIENRGWLGAAFALPGMLFYLL